MARRAAALRALREDGSVPFLYVVGADEFAAPAPNPDEDASPDLLRRVCDALKPDAVYLSKADARLFGDSPPARSVLVGSEPETKRLSVGGLSIALIFFPPLPEGATEPGPALLASVLAAANAATDVDLRIGISPWGFQGEYAARQGLSQFFHVVLGAGKGSPFALDAASAAPALWVRAPEKGRGVMTLDLFRIPPRGTSPSWTPGVDVKAREILLRDELPDDPAVSRLLDSAR